MNFIESKKKGPFWDGLKKRGYDIRKTRLGNTDILRLTAPNGNKWLTSTNGSHPATSGIVSKIAGDKTLASIYANELGISVAGTVKIMHGEIDTVKMKMMLEKYNTVVVKPVDSYGSKGVTLDIVDLNQLSNAISNAAVYSSGILIQEQVYGDELRFTVINGKTESVLLRQTPRIVGDGVSTVAYLIEKENSTRASYANRYIAYPALDDTIIDRSYVTNTTVPSIGQTVEFSRATMVKNGATVYEVGSETHQGYKDIAERFADELASSIIVVDMFVKDYKKSPEDSQYWFNELNTNPALVMYHAPVNADSSRVVDIILDKLDAAIRSGL